MPYKLTYRVDVCYLGAGQSAQTVQNAQKFTMVQQANALGGQVVGGAGAGGAITGADVTTLTNAMAADIAAQMNANIGQLAAWISGGG